MDNHEEYMDTLCYRVNDLLEDAMKWKKITHKLPTESERMMAKEIADAMFAQYKKMNDLLCKKYNEL